MASEVFRQLGSYNFGTEFKCNFKKAPTQIKTVTFAIKNAARLSTLNIFFNSHTHFFLENGPNQKRGRWGEGKEERWANFWFPRLLLLMLVYCISVIGSCSVDSPSILASILEKVGATEKRKRERGVRAKAPSQLSKARADKIFGLTSLSQNGDRKVRLVCHTSGKRNTT